MFELNTYSLVLLAHVGGAVVLVASSLWAPLVHRAILAAESFAALRSWLHFARSSSRVNPLAALVVLGTGVYLGASGWWSQAWFYVALAAWLANSVLAGAVVGRTAAALGAAAASGEGPVTGAVDALRRTPSWPIAEAIVRANDLTMLYVMFVKPSLAECFLVLGAAGVISLAAEWRAVRVPKPRTAAAVS